ncbi:protein YgfX [Vibrio mytili]|uniref:protein YgfX n=1 Tax=Vibrio mytili TaxID=50718 RepID=UPI00315843D4
MHLWSIKLSLTTSVKFVSFTTYPSTTAQIINVSLLFLMVWAVILSDVPLVICIYLLLLLLTTYREQHFVFPSVQGCWSVHCDGTVRSESGVSLLNWVDTSTLPIKLSFQLTSGKKVTIWRDSCADEHYRQLSLVLRQWERSQS